jgi:hypothetical protein
VLLVPGYVVVAVAMVSVQNLGSAQHRLPAACCPALPACELLSTPATVHCVGQAQALLRLQHGCVMGAEKRVLNTV